MKTKNIYHIILISLWCTHVFAQTGNFKKAANPDKILNELLEGSNLIQSVRSDFTQEKNISVLSEKSVSSGRFHYKKPDMIRMEYKKPFEYLMIINKGKVLVKDAGKTQQFNASSSKVFKQINELIMQSVDGSISRNKDYTVNYFENDAQFMIELLPNAKRLKAYISSIKVYFDRSDRGVNKFVMTEASGDNTTITFINKEMNAKFSDDVFNQ
jgi:outer membrane lipoprotein-sorting protein